tara:strand:+ start:172 stop:324 length:153 start_codon:yes stop_codon:yes gene_type:complete
MSRHFNDPSGRDEQVHPSMKQGNGKTDFDIKKAAPFIAGALLLILMSRRK